MSRAFGLGTAECLARKSVRFGAKYFPLMPNHQNNRCQSLRAVLGHVDRAVVAAGVDPCGARVLIASSPPKGSVYLDGSASSRVDFPIDDQLSKAVDRFVQEGLDQLSEQERETVLSEIETGGAVVALDCDLQSGRVTGQLLSAANGGRFVSRDLFAARIAEPVH